MGELLGGAGNIGGDEYHLFGKSVYYYKDSIGPCEFWKGFNKVHGD